MRTVVLPKVDMANPRDTGEDGRSGWDQNVGNLAIAQLSEQRHGKEHDEFSSREKAPAQAQLAYPPQLRPSRA